VQAAIEPPATDKQLVEQIVSGRARIGAELAKVIVGQKEVIEGLLIALLSGGHCLITGAPGLAKTLLVKSLAQIFHLKFQRIQFTPDLMPADITGTEILQETGEGRKMVFAQGPVFANMILADEINRTPPKTQAALLEAMQEHQVTAAGVRHPLPEPFFVLATQNPIEMEGTYPLPEAQLDRFMFNVVIDYLPEDEEVAVVTQTTTRAPEPIAPLFGGEDVQRFHEVVRKVPVAEDLVRYAVRLARIYPGMGELGRGLAGGAIPGAGSQGAGAAARPRPRDAGRSAQARLRDPAPPHLDQLPRRGGRDQRREGHRPSARDGESCGRSLKRIDRRGIMRARAFTLPACVFELR
jgi:MoxR-like ATPase